MRKIVLLLILVLTIGLAHFSIVACTCAGVNPDIYPPDIPKSRIYYRDEFKGAAFTGKVLSSIDAPGILHLGEKTQEVTIEVDRYWFGVDSRIVKVYTLNWNGCWVPYQKDQSYFFIPTFDKQLAFVGSCTYATFNRKHDGNYVDFMVKLFGEGKRFKPKR